MHSPTDPNAAPASSPPAPLPHTAIRAIMVGILLAMFLSALEQTIVAPALPTIGRSLHDVENLSWVVTSYLLACTTMTPLFGKLSDIHGRRVTMLAAVVIFLLGSVACALAPNMPALIAARALQGIGGGGILPIAHTIIGDMVSPRERARYQAYTSAMFLAASIVGPVLGGVLTDYLHWTMIFWINLPLGLVALVMTDRALRKLPRHDRPHKLDVPGALLMVLAALALMLAMTWGGTRHPWTSGTILGLLAGSAVLWVLFLLRLRSAEEPFIPASIMREPLMLAINVAGFCSVGVVIGLVIYMLLSRQGPLGFLHLMFTPQAIVIGYMVIALPVLVVFTLSAVQGADPRIYETARSLAAEPWRAGRHELRVNPALEDHAGNSLARPFEVNLDQRASTRLSPSVAAEIALPFSPR